ncbi:hypothetical protein SAMN04489729_2897 [Amycolatopsis lurida]|uniref:Uncharacterized protein n=1 Tax=Amycolatopsis lurida NRRL 2430 TaxID=1460371 RepID=A0A2P2FRB7_AMYLU|nr:hypothetical protein [Amycolatopsis lurida]KFU79256.1 hypothetical protein BB31_21680 [Amycolatopsis lurida NRRL 2430]SEC95188.1 hypothetical protein SAMN04489729_2897 [Amycolatopsis lurida]
MPNPRTILTGFALLFGGYYVALDEVHQLWGDTPPPQIAADFNAFALLFVLALAIERLVQPFAPILGPNSDDAKNELRTARSAGNDAGVAEAKAKLAEARSRTAIVTWGFATGLACLLAAGANITLLRAIIDPQGTQIAFWLDLLVTGLVVGAGTKPINDLWTRLQNKPADPA